MNEEKENDNKKMNSHWNINSNWTYMNIGRLWELNVKNMITF